MNRLPCITNVAIISLVLTSEVAATTNTLVDITGAKMGSHVA